MRDAFQALDRDARSLAGHHHRYMHAAQLHHEALAAALEARGLTDRVHLWQLAADPALEMGVVASAGETLEERLTFLGCYYCLQFLRLNLDAVNALRLSMISPADRAAAERHHMIQSGIRFRSLSASYMSAVLDLFLQGTQVPAYCIIGVGTKADQDDIDVGVIDAGGDGRDELNRAIGRMSAQMLRYATNLHFHISEHVGGKGYSATIPEYRAMLDGAVHDFVLISEMLSGALIVGDRELFNEFQASVVSRYYMNRWDDPKWHVGYLRGILGEVRSLIGRPLARDRIRPKDDGLRMIKGTLSALRTIHGVEEANAWRIIDSLRTNSPEDAPLYDRVEKALSFLEMFRHVYQLLVAQQEEIYLDDEIMQENLSRVAEIMGYRTVGAVTPGTRLLVDYYEHLETARAIITELTDRCARHLKKTSVFADLIDPAYPGNVAADFARRSAFFRGTTFWRDILEVLEQDDCRLLRRYVRDLNALPPAARDKVIGALEDCANYAPGTIMGFVVILARRCDSEACRELLDEAGAVFRRAFADAPNAAQRAIELFYRRPRLVNRYLSSVGREGIDALARILTTETWDSEEAFWCKKLARLADVHCRTSRFFRQYLDRVGERYQTALTLLDSQASLRDMSRGALAAAREETSIAATKERLGDFYDLEFLRIALKTLDGVPASTTDREFTEAADTFLRGLFDVCKREVDQLVRLSVATNDLVAVCASGGLGRGQAYYDDFDLLILLDTKREDVRAYANTIVARMNAAIIKRGTLPHYRFADRFGRYVTTLDELEGALSADRRDVFVDQSQALEARMIVGTRRFAAEYRRRIVEPHVFQRRGEYVRAMRQEIESRHADERVRGGEFDNVKNGIGGLRDIAMLLLMYKAAWELDEPVDDQLLETALRIDPEHRRDLLFLSGALQFLKNLRSVYRMCVGAEDRLRPEHLAVVASVMGLCCDCPEDAQDRLLRAYRGCMTQVGEIVTSIAQDLERRAAQ